MNSKITNIGIYKIISICGKGAYGTVYRVENSLSKQILALKVLNNKHDKRELEALIRYRECQHDNLLKIYHVDTTKDGLLFYTMDIADNLNEDNYLPDTLGNRIIRNGRIEATELKKIIIDMINAIEYLQSFKIVHRDIKPDNIIFVNGKAVLADVGLIGQNDLSSIVGTAQFISPEVKSGKKKLNQTSDIYALGMVIYCCLTGNAPLNYPRLPKDIDKSSHKLLTICDDMVKNKCSLQEIKQKLLSNSKKKYSKSIIISCSIFIILITILFFLFLMSYEKNIKKDDTFVFSNKIPGEIPLRYKIDNFKKIYSHKERLEIFDEIASLYGDIPKEELSKSLKYYNKISDMIRKDKAKLYPNSDERYIEIQQEIKERKKSDKLFYFGYQEFCFDLEKDMLITDSGVSHYEKRLQATLIERYRAYLDYHNSRHL